MASDCTFFRSSMAFTVCAPFYSEDGSGLLILPLVNGFHEGFRAVFLSGWRRIAHSFSRQRLSRRFSRRIAPRMAADCSYLRSPTAFTMVFAPYCSADGSVLLILPLANSFHDGFRAVLLCGWQRIVQSSTCQQLSRRFARRIAQRMVSDCPHLHSPAAFMTICTPYCTPDGAADRSFFLSSTAFLTVCAPYCSADGSGLLIPPLINGFHDGFRAVLLSGWQRIGHSSARQKLSRRFARRIAQRVVSDCSIFRSPTAFTTICAPQIAHRIARSSARRRQLSPAGSRTVFLSGWQRITHSSACQRLSRLFARRIAQRMAADCSFFLSSTAFTTICAPYCSADGSGLLIPPLINGFHDGLRAVLLYGWQRIAQSSARQQLSRRFARRIAQRMVSDCPTSARLRLSRRFARRIAQRMALHCSHLR